MQIPDLSALEKLGTKLRSEGKRIGWTNGCFDLIHPGHLSTFRYLREQTDFVVVGLNADNSPYFSTKPGRPIHDQDFRALMLLGLRDIDAVYVYADENPIPSLLALKPDLCVK